MSKEIKNAIYQIAETLNLPAQDNVPGPLSVEVQELAKAEGISEQQAHQLLTLKSLPPEKVPVHLRLVLRDLEAAEANREEARRALEKQIGNERTLSAALVEREKHRDNIAQAESALKALAGNEALYQELEKWPEYQRVKPVGYGREILLQIAANEIWEQFLPGWLKRAKEKLAKMDADIAGMRVEFGIK